MALGTPNITIGAAQFNSTIDDGVYTLSTAVHPNRDVLSISRQLNKNDLGQRVKVERLLDLAANGTTDPVRKTLRVYLVIDAPQHSGATSTLIQAVIGNINTLCTTANVAAMLRGEV